MRSDFSLNKQSIPSETDRNSYLQVSYSNLRVLEGSVRVLYASEPGIIEYQLSSYMTVLFCKWIVLQVLIVKYLGSERSSEFGVVASKIRPTQKQC